MRVELSLIAGIVLVGAFARADAVYLQGGRVLQGNATLDGDKVTVELESGRMSFARSEVVRIEKSTSPNDEAAAREKKLAKDDVPGMLDLASYCRDHDLPGRERELLERVIARQPEHAEARRRLGYVREGNEWVLRSEQLRKERVAQQAQRDSDLARRRQQLELEEAQLRRDRAEAALKAERERPQQVVVQQPSTPTWYSPVWVAPAHRPWNNGWNQHTPLQQQQPWTVPGPATTSHDTLHGVRTSQSYFDEAYRNVYGRPPAH